MSDSKNQHAKLPQVGRAAVLRHGYGKPYEIDNEFPVTAPGFLEALIHIETSGVCFGDIFSRDGQLPAPPTPHRPLVGGHEGVGRVVALGSSASLVSDIEVGDLVGVGWRHSACGKCVPCLKGAENACYEQMVNGLEVDGTFQEYLSVPAQHVLKIPTGLTPEKAAPILCAGGTVLAALRNIQVVSGQWVAISGAAGGLGHLAIQYAKFMGLKVVAIDGGKGEKEEFCLDLGADMYFNFMEKKDLVGEIMEATGGGVHGSIILSSNKSSYLQAILYSRHMAKIVGMGICVVDLPIGLLMKKNIWLTGQGNATRVEIADALAVAAQPSFRVVTELLPLQDVNIALDRLKASAVKGRIVLLIGTTESGKVQGVESAAG